MKIRTTQKLTYFGHLHRKDGLKKRVLDTLIPGVRERGRARTRWERELESAFNSVTTIVRETREGGRFRHVTGEALL